MSPRYANDVYYSLHNGTVKTAPNSDWQLAFSIGSFNVGARANTATMSGGHGSVSMYEMPGKDTSKWTAFDTAGYSSWKSHDNSDTDWQGGCFNQGSTGQFDYGWGKYNSSNHVVVGHRLYLLKIKNNSSTVFKKLRIRKKELGNWTVTFANLDGSGTHTHVLKSSDYSGKNFVYLDVLNNVVRDREPANKEWDFVLTRYKSYQAHAGIYYPSTGILSNRGVVAAKADKVNVNTVKLADHIKDTSKSLSAIGYNWKGLGPGFKWVMEDSLVYFVKDKYGRFWKLEFTGFGGSGTGKTYLTKTQLTWATSTKTLASAPSLAIYPNPANNRITILTDQEQTEVSIITMDGRTVIRRLASQFESNLDIGSLKTGIYIVKVKSPQGSTTQRLYKN